MRKSFFSKTAIFLCVFCLFFSVFPNVAIAEAEENYVYVCGNIVGFELDTNGALITENCGIRTDFGVFCCDELQVGDVIKEINGSEICTATDVGKALAQCEKGAVEVVVSRKNEKFTLHVEPLLEVVSGEKKLGVKVKDKIEGLGTITCCDEFGEFVALGHEVIDYDSSTPIYGMSGRITGAKLIGIDKGQAGKAGSVKGQIIRKNLGVVSDSRKFGIKGRLACNDINLNKVKVADDNQVKMGDATIISNVSGELKNYDIKIVKAGNWNENDGKNIVLKVVDRNLLSLTGGIIQGMSGSPIIQDGMLVGAVTHVFVNDPTRGYGVSASKLLG